MIEGTLKQRRVEGQVTLEYFILFAATAALTVVGFQMFGADVSGALQEFMNAAASKIAN